MIPLLQLESLTITVVVFILSLILTIFLTKSYLKKKGTSLMFWSLGMWAFTIGMILEIIFALGIYSELLISSYLFIVAILVEFLALGSINLIKSRKIKLAYYGFCIITTVFMLYTLVILKIPNLVINYIVYGPLPILVVYSSSFITFPAAAVLVIVAASSYIKRKDYRYLSIISGVIIVSIAGTLYIVTFPSLLYLAEFLGIVLLWIGFFRSKG
jgi:hypothetical protein